METVLQTAVAEADVITTVTTSTATLIESSWVRAGTHISAMGSDKIGKQELSPSLLERAKLFADHPAQSQEIGEFQHLPNATQQLTAIGHALREPDKHGYNPDTITIFDSSGIALQDISIAYGIYLHLKREGRLRFIDM